jgi:hypothetical protein
VVVRFIELSSGTLRSKYGYIFRLRTCLQAEQPNTMKNKAFGDGSVRNVVRLAPDMVRG